MHKVFKFFNLFSQAPSFKINGETRPSSVFGSIIGFLTLSTLIAAISLILNDYLSRLNYSVNSYTDNLAKPEIDLKNFKLGFLITDLMGKEYPDHEKLFTISALYWDVFLPQFGENKTQTIQTVPIPSIKCDEFKDDFYLKESFDLYAKSYNLTCLDLNVIQKNLTGIYGNLGG